MAARPWYETTTREGLRGIEAADWRRRVEVGRFRSADPRNRGTLDELIADTSTVSRENPLRRAPRPKGRSLG